MKQTQWEGSENVGPPPSSPTPGDLLCYLPFGKELIVHTCCKRFGSDHLRAKRYCPIRRENKVVGGHMTTDTDGLNQMQKLKKKRFTGIQDIGWNQTKEELPT